MPRSVLCNGAVLAVSRSEQPPVAQTPQSLAQASLEPATFEKLQPWQSHKTKFSHPCNLLPFFPQTHYRCHTTIWAANVGALSTYENPTLRFMHARRPRCRVVLTYVHVSGVLIGDSHCTLRPRGPMLLRVDSHLRGHALRVVHVRESYLAFHARSPSQMSRGFDLGPRLWRPSRRFTLQFLRPRGPVLLLVDSHLRRHALCIRLAAVAHWLRQCTWSLIGSPKSRPGRPPAGCICSSVAVTRKASEA